MSREAILLAGDEDVGTRLDLFLASACPGCSRSYAKTLIAQQRILVNGSEKKPGYQVRSGDRIHVSFPEPVAVEAYAQPIPLEIAFEDNDLLVVDKPAGMVVHPAPGARDGTLVNALLAHCTDLSGINGVLRPGIVHRLDRGTSGLLLVAKNDLAHRSLAGQLKARRIARQYTALVWGGLREPAGKIEGPIGRHPRDRKKMAVSPDGRPSVTHYEVTSTSSGLSLLALRLETGRTHQIRVHLSHVGHPVFGDPTYGGREERLQGVDPQTRNFLRPLLSLLPRQALHAARLGFVHPSTGEWMEFSSEPPEDFRNVLESLQLR